MAKITGNETQTRVLGNKLSRRESGIDQNLGHSSRTLPPFPCPSVDDRQQGVRLFSADGTCRHFCCLSHAGNVMIGDEIMTLTEI